MALAASWSRRGSGSGRRLNRAIDSVLRHGIAGQYHGSFAFCEMQTSDRNLCSNFLRQRFCNTPTHTQNDTENVSFLI
jgi:hypothetical protein